MKIKIIEVNRLIGIKNFKWSPISGFNIVDEDEILKREAEEIIEIFENIGIRDTPSNQIRILTEMAKDKLPQWGNYGIITSVYLLGHRDGVRTERSKRRNRVHSTKFAERA